MLTDKDDSSSGEITAPNSEPVTLTEDDAIGDDNESQDSESSPQRAQGREPKTGRWAQKKAERAARHNELTTLKTEHQTTLQKLAALEAERATWQQVQRQAPVQMQSQPAPPRQDPAERELGEINAALEAELQLLEKDASRSPKRYNELQDRKQEIRTMRIIAQMNGQQRQQPQQREDGVAPEQAARFEILAADHSWLRGTDAQSQKMLREANHYRRYLIQGLGRPDTIDTDREAITHVAAQNGYSARRTAPRGVNAFAAPPARGGGNNGSGPRSLTIPPQLVGGTGLSKQALAQAVLSDDE